MARLLCAYSQRAGKAELSWMAGHALRWFTRWQTVTHPSTNVNVNNVNNKFIEREGTKVSNALECRLQY